LKKFPNKKNLTLLFRNRIKIYPPAHTHSSPIIQIISPFDNNGRIELEIFPLSGRGIGYYQWANPLVI